jgi:hypothetical protein
MAKKTSAKAAAAKVAEALKDAAATAEAAEAATKAADEYVVGPAKKALGLTQPKAKVKTKKARYVRPERRPAAAEAAPKARVKRTAAGKVMSQGVAKGLPKKGAKAPPKSGPAPR